MNKIITTPFGEFELNVEKSPVDKRDFIAEAILGDGELPEEYTTRSKLMPVRDQGRQGTCAAQTAACMKEWQERTDINFQDYMSPQFVYNNRSNQSSSGMYTRDLMKILHKTGICPEAKYPYGTFDEIPLDLLEEAKKHVIESYASVSTIEGLKKAIYKNGPCLIAVPVYNYGGRMWKPEQGQSMIGGHAMTVTGWTKEGFEIRNSWSDRWGNDGYTIFPWEDWGLQWEVWTTIDASSGDPLPDPPKTPWYKKFFRTVWKYIKYAFYVISTPGGKSNRKDWDIL